MSSDQVLEQQTEKARKKGRGVMLTLALLVFLVLVVPVVGYLIFTMRSANLVEAELAKIRAAGEPATAEELDAYYEYPPAEEDTTRLWLAGTKPFASGNEKYDEDCGELPIVGNSEEEKIIPPPGEEWEDLEAVEEFLAKYAEPLELLHQAADKGGAARYPVDFSDGLFADLSCIQVLRYGARVLSLQAHVRAHREDAHGAAESIHVIVMLAQSLEKEPVFVSQLVRMSIHSMACELLRELLPYAEFSDEDLASLRAVVQAVDNDVALERTIIGERALLASAFLDPASIDDEIKDSVLSRFGARNDDLLFYLQYMNDMLTAARNPWPQRLDDMEAVEDDLVAFADKASVIARFRYGFTLLLGPAVGRLPEAFARSESTTRAADAALAIEQFSRKNDRLPDKLDELVPEFLDKVPIDPFDGKPLRYAVREDAYVIYSIGTDRVDDGGQIIEEKDEFGDDVENPDLIFPVKR